METQDKYILIGILLGLALTIWMLVTIITSKPQNPHYDYSKAVCVAPRPAPGENVCKVK